MTAPIRSTKHHLRIGPLTFSKENEREGEWGYRADNGKFVALLCGRGVAARGGILRNRDAALILHVTDRPPTAFELRTLSGRVRKATPRWVYSLYGALETRVADWMGYEQGRTYSQVGYGRFGFFVRLHSKGVRFWYWFERIERKTS